MPIDIREVGREDLDAYSAVSNAFEVQSVLRVEPADGGLGGLRLREEPVGVPYVKDNDSLSGSGPLAWHNDFNLDGWGFLLAVLDGKPAGGAAIAVNALEMWIAYGRGDWAVLWDIRVRSDLRRSGVGTALLDRAAAWARDRGCNRLRIETQNVNVPGCRFYAGYGCELGGIDRFVYAGDPNVGHEVMLVWDLEL